IRHGESTDNLRSVWAGWEDAPLSNHGKQQARAMGQSFTETRFTAIYASTLKRAFTTAQALYDGQKDPKPTFTSSPLLREQHFGIAEGKPWTYHREKGMTLEEQFDQGKFPVLHHDDEKFPGGESLNDLAARANRAIEELVLPHVWTAAKEGEKGVHIALVSHGLCISQLMIQLLKHNTDGPDGGDYRGLKNTAWSRVTVSIKQGLKEGERLESVDDAQSPLDIRVTDIDRHSHIENIVCAPLTV
ncbi:hypothetical protein HETIRDRAFT_25713, partial [Heterobasidion irregulare TC 32-1]